MDHLLRNPEAGSFGSPFPPLFFHLMMLRCVEHLHHTLSKCQKMKRWSIKVDTNCCTSVEMNLIPTIWNDISSVHVGCDYGCIICPIEPSSSISISLVMSNVSGDDIVM